MEITYIELFHKSGKELLHLQKGICSWNDIEIEYTKDGKIFIKADKSGIFGIRCHIANTYFDNPLILTDAWERAYGDLCWEPVSDRISPWYFIAYENNITYGFGVKTQTNSMCSWGYNCDEIVLDIDIRNGSNPIFLAGRVLQACETVVFKSEKDIYSAISDFCEEMCDSPRTKNTIIYGGNDWYCNYGNNSYEKITEHTRRIVECSPDGEIRPFMVIDDGWQLYHQSGDDCEYFNGGPWSYCNEKFKDMKKLATEICALGAIPGIWFRPLWTAEKFPQECILRQEGNKYALDPSSETTLKQVETDIKTIVGWGYKLIKHDFTTFDIFGQWGFEMTGDIYKGEVNFSDKTKTTAEIIKNFYHVIRKAAGEDVLIMGCNTISHLSAGVFDIQRTGDDTSGREWERTKKMGINTLAFRMCQHNKFYLADADCVGITNDIKWDKNKQWLDVLAKSGTPVFVSIADDAYTDEIKADIKKAFDMAVKNTTVSKPLDWLETNTPQKWESCFGTDEYDWS